jgi:hypothetical protein
MVVNIVTMYQCFIKIQPPVEKMYRACRDLFCVMPAEGLQKTFTDFNLSISFTHKLSLNVYLTLKNNNRKITPAIEKYLEISKNLVLGTQCFGLPHNQNFDVENFNSFFSTPPM